MGVLWAKEEPEGFPHPQGCRGPCSGQEGRKARGRRLVRTGNGTDGVFAATADASGSCGGGCQPLPRPLGARPGARSAREGPLPAGRSQRGCFHRAEEERIGPGAPHLTGC